MNYEEKYKQALERARDLMTNQKPPAFDKHLIEMVFPELKESEDKDEMIRQCLIEHIKCNKDLNWSLFQWFKPDTIIAWLEKQGKQTQLDYEHADIPQKDFVPIKPKFKVGDWIIFNGLILRIDEVVNGYYTTTSIGDDIHNSYDWDIDNIAKLWTIQDAKDGDEDIELAIITTNG